MEHDDRVATLGDATTKENAIECSGMQLNAMEHKCMLCAAMSRSTIAPSELCCLERKEMLRLELQSPVIELPKNRTLDRTRTSPCRTAVQSSQNLRAKNRKKPVQKDRSGPVWTGFLHSHTCRVNDTCKWLKKQCLDDFLSQNDKYRLKDCGCFVLAAPQTFVLNP
jgi:hypothetical protein